MNRKAVAAFVLVASSASLMLAHDGIRTEAPLPRPSYSRQAVVDFPASGVQLMGWIPVTDFDSSYVEGNDCWGYTSPSGREYAIMGLNAGTGFVEITDPGAPQIIDVFAGPDSSWHDIKVYADHAYVVSEAGGGIRVFDMTSIDSGTVTQLASVTGGGCTSQSHNVALDTTSGFLYRTGGSSTPCSGSPQGLVIYDLANPASPSFVGSWNDRYVHDAQVVTWDIAGPFFGKQIAFCAAETSSGGGTPTLHILDVTDKGSISVIGTTGYATSAFSHQVWLSDDKTVLYLNDEIDELNNGYNTRTRMIDVSDLTSPTSLGFFSSGTNSIDHNLYVNGNRIYEANYRSGLRIFDNTNPVSPTQIAWFDTYPDDNGAAFNGLWSNYPFFPSGTVIGSDLEKGLFVWYVGDALLSFAYPSGVPDLIPSGGGTVTFEVNELNSGDLMGGTVRFHYDTGGGYASVLATPVGGNLYEAALPGLACGDQVSFYVSAQSTNGYTWTDPPAAPTQANQAIAAAYVESVFFDDIETDLGWTSGAAGDDATTGIWVRGNPRGTAAQPENDHSVPGVNCWFTGQGSAGGSVGENDVDGGTTTLVSATFDATGLSDPSISYWRWYSNNQGGAAGEDTFLIDISNNNGSSWTPLEVVGPTGLDVTGGWILHSERISDFVTPTNQIKLRFRASDLGSGSIVEAAVDDVEISDLVCTVGISSVSPDKGSFNGRNAVTITGEGFVEGVTTVAFGGVESQNVTVLSGTMLQASVPRPLGQRAGRLGAAQLKVDVRVTTGGGSATLPNAYTYELPTRSR